MALLLLVCRGVCRAPLSCGPDADGDADGPNPVGVQAGGRGDASSGRDLRRIKEAVPEALAVPVWPVPLRAVAGVPPPPV